MKTRVLIIICLISALLIPVNSIQALPEFLNCTYDSDFVISTNKLEFVPDETFVLNVKTVQNDGVFEIVVIDPKGKEVFADVVDADKNDYAQTRFHIPDDALKGTWSVFVTASPSHKQEVIFIGVDETPQPTLSIKPSFVNHKYKVDDASFLLAGKPDTDIQVNVLGPNDEMMHVYIVTLTLEGKCNFVLDLDEYKRGVYTVEVSDHTDDATAVFTVGLPTITGAIAVNLFSDSYFFGDDIFVSIHTAPEIDLTIEVKDPSGNLVHQLDATSEKNGTLHTSVRLPDYGKNGTWAITARSGANFDTQEFNVTLNPQDVDSARIPSGSFSPDKTVYPTPWEDRSPLQQFKDGIDPKVIHCNNDLVLIQKYDGNPACVTESTKIKLIERGWTSGNVTSFCFMEHLPVCGVDGKTYGNLCLLNKSNVKLYHDGECISYDLSHENVIQPTKIIIEVVDRHYTEQVFPIRITEATSNIAKADKIQSWFFLPIDRGEKIKDWNFVTNSIFRIVDKDGNDAIDRSVQEDYGFLNDVSRGAPITCNNEEISMKYRTPTIVSIKDNVTETFGIYSNVGYPPSVYKNETLKFASFFDQDIMLPDHAILISNRSEICSVNYMGFTTAYYDEVVFQFTR